MKKILFLILTLLFAIINFNLTNAVYTPYEYKLKTNNGIIITNYNKVILPGFILKSPKDLKSNTYRTSDGVVVQNGDIIGEVIKRSYRVNKEDSPQPGNYNVTFPFHTKYLTHSFIMKKNNGKEVLMSSDFIQIGNEYNQIIKYQHDWKTMSSNVNYFIAKKGNGKEVLVKDGIEISREYDKILRNQDISNNYIMVKNNGNLINLTNGVETTIGDYTFAYSIDTGKFMVYVARKSNGKEVLIRGNFITGEYDKVLNYIISPNGEKISFIVKRNGKYFILENGREKSKAYNYISWLSYSPDSKNLVFFGIEDNLEMVSLVENYVKIGTYSIKNYNNYNGWFGRDYIDIDGKIGDQHQFKFSQDSNSYSFYIKTSPTNVGDKITKNISTTSEIIKKTTPNNVNQNIQTSTSNNNTLTSASNNNSNVQDIPNLLDNLIFNSQSPEEIKLNNELDIVINKLNQTDIGILYIDKINSWIKKVDINKLITINNNIKKFNKSNVVLSEINTNILKYIELKIDLLILKK